jgi:hypothetical protein
LLSFSDGIGPWRASGNGAAWPVFNGNRSSFRWCSGCKDCSNGDDVGGGSSSKRLIDTRDSASTVAAAMAKSGSVWGQTHGESFYL